MDHIVCLLTKPYYSVIGFWYLSFVDLFGRSVTEAYKHIETCSNKYNRDKTHYGTPGHVGKAGVVYDVTNRPIKLGSAQDSFW